MIVILHLFLLLLAEITCGDIVSAEKDYIHKERKDKHVSNTENLDLDNRRFLQDLDDSEWHVAHLKDTEFSRRSECAGDSLQDRVNNYRKALKNDGALVEFVSADPLPFNASDLQQSNRTCQNPSNYTIFLKKYKSPKYERNSTFKSNEPSNVEQSNVDEKQKSFENGTITIDEGVRTATTANVKKTLGKGDKVRNKTESRRASEYQFSSVEYYDEITQFDENMCPDAIEVITLEIDQIRSYDIECESILEWRSLE